MPSPRPALPQTPCKDCGYERWPCPSCGIPICNCVSDLVSRMKGQFGPNPDARLKWRRHWYEAP